MSRPRVYKNAWVQRFARKERIADTVLCDAVERASHGLIDADLGGGVIKQRIARPGAGRSGGYRALVFFRRGERVVFVFGFAKKDRDNIDADELAVLRKSAKVVLALPQSAIDVELASGRFMEVFCGDEEEVS
jgi:hypothetical protein